MMKNLFWLLLFQFILINSYSQEEIVIQKFTAHNGIVNCLTYSPGGKYMVSAGTDRLIKVWDMSNRSLLYKIEAHEGSVESVAFSPDGKYLISGGDDNYIKLWDFSTGNMIRAIKAHKDVINCIAFSPDGKFFATASSDRSVKVWTFPLCDLVHVVEHLDLAISVAFSPNSNYFISGGEDNMAKVWDAKTGKWVRTYNHSAAVNTVSFSSNGNYVMSAGNDKVINIWDFIKDKKIRELKGHESWVNIAIFTKDFKKVISASQDSTIKYWEIDKDTLEVYDLETKISKIRSMCLSPDEKYLIRGSFDGTVRIINIEESLNYAKSKKPSSNQTIKNGSSLPFSAIFDNSKDNPLQINGVRFKDDNGNDVIENNEYAVIFLDIENTSKVDIANTTCMIAESTLNKDITYKPSVNIPLIKAGGKKEIKFILKANSSVKARNTNFKINLKQAKTNYNPIIVNVKIENIK